MKSLYIYNFGPRYQIPENYGKYFICVNSLTHNLTHNKTLKVNKKQKTFIHSKKLIKNNLGKCLLFIFDKSYRHSFTDLCDSCLNVYWFCDPQRFVAFIIVYQPKKKKRMWESTVICFKLDFIFPDGCLTQTVTVYIKHNARYTYSSWNGKMSLFFVFKILKMILQNNKMPQALSIIKFLLY